MLNTELVRAALDSSREPTLIFSLESGIIFANRAAEPFLLRSPVSIHFANEGEAKRFSGALGSGRSKIELSCELKSAGRIVFECELLSTSSKVYCVRISSADAYWTSRCLKKSGMNAVIDLQHISSDAEIIWISEGKDLIGKSAFSPGVVSKEHFLSLATTFNSVSASTQKEPRCCQYSYDSADGKKKLTVDLEVLPIENFDNDRLRFLVRTVQKESTSWLESLWQKYRAVLPIAIGIVRVLEDERDLEILAGNDPTKNILGLPPDKPLQLPLKLFKQGIAPRDEVDFWLERYRETRASPSKILTFECQAPRASVNSGKPWFAITLHLEADIFTFHVSPRAELRDEDELRRQRAELEALVKSRTQQLEQAMQVKNRFIATMSHEMRTPLSGVIGSMCLLSDRDLTVEQQEIVNIAQVCSNQLLSVINDVLELSKLAEDKLELDPVPFSLHEALEESMQVLWHAADKKGLELIIDVEPSAELLLGDVNRFRQIVVNLLSNAVKFTDRGEVHLTGKMRLIEKDQDEFFEVLVSVADTGVGIAESARKIIFEPFTQADSSTTRKYGGSGLGLHICLRLARMMQGTLWFESEEGKGTTFFLRVLMHRYVSPLSPSATSIPGSISTEIDLHCGSPRASFSQSSSYAALPENGTSRSGSPVASVRTRAPLNTRVMIIDGNQSSLRVLADKLIRWGFRVGTSSHIEMALEELAQWSRQAAEAHETQCSKRSRTETGSPKRSSFEENSLKIVFLDVRLWNSKLVEDLKNLKCEPIYMGMRRPDTMRGVRFLKKPWRNQLLANALNTLQPQLLQLPSGSLSVVTHESALLPPATPAPLRVLLADDNVMNQRVIKKILESIGVYDPTVVGNGKEAIAAIAKSPFDVILMDLMMPVMGGIEATQHIRAMPHIHQPYIFALTASVLVEDHIGAQRAGMHGVVTKPIKRAELATIMNRIRLKDPTVDKSFYVSIERERAMKDYATSVVNEADLAVMEASLFGPGASESSLPTSSPVISSKAHSSSSSAVPILSPLDSPQPQRKH